ncbi:MAG: hypothetical protein CM1200mP12_07490 [Gammaproteobacteria bacterium]|nr:MAG: hypothetical protein CM1200mP12_07490 [Gammaproteobacteria bacterium]
MDKGIYYYLSPVQNLSLFKFLEVAHGEQNPLGEVKVDNLLFFLQLKGIVLPVHPPQRQTVILSVVDKYFISSELKLFEINKDKTGLIHTDLIEIFYLEIIFRAFPVKPKN